MTAFEEVLLFLQFYDYRNRSTEKESSVLGNTVLSRDMESEGRHSGLCHKHLPEGY